MNEVHYVTHQAEIRSGRSLESRIQEAVGEAQEPLSLQEVAEAAQAPLRSRGEVLSLLSALRQLVKDGRLVHDTVRDKWAVGRAGDILEGAEISPQENRPQPQRKRGRR